MLKRGVLLFLVITVVGFNSCESDFSLNGDYQIQPVVFGLLDHRQDVHMIKITKAFLGDGDNLTYAQNPDSNYFEKVEAEIVEFKNDVATGRSWTLTDTIVTNKSEDGLFYAPEQKAYVFYESALDSTAEYELTVIINDGAHVVTGKTTLIPEFKITGTVTNPSYKIQFAPNTVNEDADYDNWTFTVSEGLHAARYNYKYTFRWTETYSDMSTASFSATRNNGDVFQSSPDKPGQHGASFAGLDFYQFVADAIVQDPDVIQRKMDGLDLQIAIAHDDLNQFMEVSQPVTGIAQVQPEFTNLTGGRGLFSSRIIFKMNNFNLNPASVKELCTGLYTGGLLFCSDYPEHASETWYCP
ncbi:MAG: DUF4249 family protein [Crocinitomicaceae bacterium]|nr:DUF4249 family protein [Crocinitomicaceae bacterium]